MKHLSLEQVRYLIAATDGARNKLLLTLTYEHGLRISEALSITKSHVKRGHLSIKGRKKGKRADERLSTATLELFEKVSANKLPHTLLFPFSRQWSHTIFHRAAQRAGITLQLRQGIHTLRHSLAHHLLDAGASLPVVLYRCRTDCLIVRRFSKSPGADIQYVQIDPIVAIEPFMYARYDSELTRSGS
jgi:integrase